VPPSSSSIRVGAGSPLGARAGRRIDLAAAQPRQDSSFARRVARLPAQVMHDLLDLLQWPAMLVTVLASWWVASTQRHKRAWGFWAYLLSNALWSAWGWHTSATALVVLQACLAAMNIRGYVKASGSRDGAARKA
jgi:hypothetical protein